MLLCRDTWFARLILAYRPAINAHKYFELITFCDDLVFILTIRDHLAIIIKLLPSETSEIIKPRYRDKKTTLQEPANELYPQFIHKSFPR